MTGDIAPYVRENMGISDIRVVFQPIVDLKTQAVFAYETLVRPQDPKINHAGHLIESAVNSNCIGELGRWIRQLAVSTCRGQPLFINVHPRELEDGWLVRPDDAIFQHEHPIYLELTEATPLSQEHYTRSSLEEIRSKGIRLAVDDLGSGYSNINYIAELSPEVVKLDRGLVSNLKRDSRAFKLVRSITQLCVDLDAQVVGEGIETAEDLQSLKEAGVHFGQGYFIARPGFPPPLPSCF